MTVFELSHIFFRTKSELVYSFKNLGFFLSYESALRALQFYKEKPGFYENKDAFSIRERMVSGAIENDTVYEVMVYFHTDDYDFEAEISLGLYGSEKNAYERINRYCMNNDSLINADGLVCERIVNRCIIEEKKWSEGFTICD